MTSRISASPGGNRISPPTGSPVRRSLKPTISSSFSIRIRRGANSKDSFDTARWPGLKSRARSFRKLMFSRRLRVFVEWQPLAMRHTHDDPRTHSKRRYDVLRCRIRQVERHAATHGLPISRNKEWPGSCLRAPCRLPIFLARKSLPNHVRGQTIERRAALKHIVRHE